MARRRLTVWLMIATGALAVLLIVSALIWRDDILEALLDPKIPFAVYQPPPKPNYALAGDWALLPADQGESQPADVFFVHPTTFNGGKDWNGSITDPASATLLDREMLPNYAAPYATAGRVFAPRYRQASLYTSLTVFDDAREARAFAYNDVAAAFDYFLAHFNHGRPFILVGVEQGGALAARLLSAKIAPAPSLRGRLVSAYLIDAIVPAEAYGPDAAIPACQRREQTGCVLAWFALPRLDFGRAAHVLHRSMVWDDRGRLIPLAGRAALCVNPLLGAQTDAAAPERFNRGAANATGLEWGVTPAFMVRQVGAQCRGGILRVTKPRSASLRPFGPWADRLKVPGYNLFYADVRADAERRLAAWRAVSPPRPALKTPASQRAPAGPRSPRPVQK